MFKHRRHPERTKVAKKLDVLLMMKLIEILLVCVKLRERPMKLMLRILANVSVKNRKLAENVNVAKDLHGKFLATNNIQRFKAVIFKTLFARMSYLEYIYV